MCDRPEMFWDNVERIGRYLGWIFGNSICDFYSWFVFRDSIHDKNMGTFAAGNREGMTVRYMVCIEVICGIYSGFLFRVDIWV